MGNKVLHTVLLIHLLLTAAAGQDSSAVLSLNTFNIIGIYNPWLSTSNPAGMAFNPRLFPAEIDLDYYGERGDFKKVQQGEKLNDFRIDARSYAKTGKSLFYGNFYYRKSFEKGTNYTDVYNPYRGTPYTLIDSIGGDIYDREFFFLDGAFTTPLSRNLSLGLSTRLDVGLASQDRDPRPMNKVLKLNLSPGLLFRLPVLNIGINFLYSYYNEDIEIEVIEQNKEYVFFQMHGLATYTSHEANSFYRLYKQNKIGFAGQMDMHLGKINDLAGIRLQYALETADDGRKASNATWSTIKNDSRYKINSLYVFNITTINKEFFIHWLKADLKLSGMLGTEIIQRLETSGETGISNWVTYADEEKYDASELQASLEYRLMKMKRPYVRNCEMDFNVNYHKYEQDYYIPDREEGYSHLIFSLKYGKSFYPGRHLITVAGDLWYKRNLSSTLNFTKNNFFYNKLLLPDHLFQTYNYYAPGIDLAWEIPMKKIFNKYFFNTNFKLYVAETGATRSVFSFSTGLIF